MCILVRKVLNTINKKSIILITFSVIIVLLCSLIQWDEKLLLPLDLPDIDTEYEEQPPPFNTFNDKLWLHGVNDYDRVDELDDHKGMEIDIHYSSLRDEFYVTHDPDPAEYLILDSLLASIDDIEEYHIWLDFKNLNEYNYKQALFHLSSVCNDLNIEPGNIIVESMEPYYLSEYTSYGYNTSYYLPIFSPYDVSNKEITEYVEEITYNLNNSQVTFISADYKLYHFIKEYFPDSEMLLWQHHWNLLSPYLRHKMLEDPDVKVLLVR